MSDAHSVNLLRSYLLQSRELVEVYANEPAAKKHLGLLDQLLGPYVATVSAGKVKVTDHDLRVVESHLKKSREAQARGSLRELLDHNRAMISALPGDPLTVPR